MKKTFSLIHPKKQRPRMVDAVKNDVRKYIKRERRKELPDGVDFWDFDCRFGDAEPAAKEVHESAMIGAIDDAVSRGLDSFYIEILAKPGRRTRKPKPLTTEVPDPSEKGNVDVDA